MLRTIGHSVNGKVFQPELFPDLFPPPSLKRVSFPKRLPKPSRAVDGPCHHRPCTSECYLEGRKQQFLSDRGFSPEDQPEAWEDELMIGTGGYLN